jgi:hypothetical protein
VAQQVIEAVHRSGHYGTTELFEAVLGSARKDAAEAERAEVAAEVLQLVASSRRSPQALGAPAGYLSIPPLHLQVREGSTYRSGKVIPSATLMIRMRHAAAQAHSRR